MMHFITFRSSHSASKLKNAGIMLGVAAFWLTVWQIAYVLVAQDILLVSPVQAVARMLAIITENKFWQTVACTCLRVLSGFLLAVIFGTVLAMLSHRFKLLYHLIAPFMGMIRAIPVVSIIILVLLWFVTDRVPVFIVFQMALPVIWGNVLAGIKSTDIELLEMARLFKLARLKTLRYIYIPAILPYFTAASSAALGLSWKSAIAAEVIARPSFAVGSMIYDSKIYLETTDLFAWTMLIILISLIVEKAAASLFRLIGNKLWRIQPEGGEENSSAR